MRSLRVATTQMACAVATEENLDRAEALVREAAAQGAQVVALQELFATPYFCPDQDMQNFALARPFAGHPMIARFSALARSLQVVLPINFFEQDQNQYYNSLAMIDADGAVLGLYRKSHIPQASGYEEKFYFTPGNTGFRVFDTRYARIGAGICWDQWFPECARALALQGAELLLYPTAIGTEPHNLSYDSCSHWRRTMQGHAAANMVPVVAANRIGVETHRSCSMEFYGSSFITDQFGQIVSELDRRTSSVTTAEFDLEALRLQRASWGLFRDRRPDLYGLLSKTEAGPAATGAQV